MSGAAAGFSTPFAAANARLGDGGGDHGRDAAGAEGRRKMSTRLSALMLDEAFDSRESPGAG